MNASISDVAKAANVSVATVSRVFNAPDKVSPETRERVNAAIRELGYAPNIFARHLRTQRSQTLGVVLPTLLNPVFAECFIGMTEAANEKGYAIQPFFTDYLIERETMAVNALTANNVEGIALTVSNPATSTALMRMRTVHCPYALAYNDHEDHPCVTVDGQQAMAEVVTYLAQLGHQRIAMVTGTLHTSDRAQQRYLGYQNAMQSLGLPVMPVTEVPFIQSAIDRIGELLGSASSPTALIGSNDLIALRCMRAAQLHGLRIPQDLSIVGFDGVRLLDDIHPKLATVQQPNHEIGRQCVQLLIQSIEARTMLSPHSSLRLAYQFEAAESCHPPIAD